MNRRVALAAVAGVMFVAACGGSESPASSDGAAIGGVETVVEVPSDRSLDVSYADGLIAVSFEPLGFPPRSMSGELYRESGEGWMLFGYLLTETADFPSGSFVLASDGAPQRLDGVLNAAQPDVYDAADLSPADYLACTALIENQEAVCGAFSIAGEGG